MKLKEGQVWYTPKLDRLVVCHFDIIHGLIFHAHWDEGFTSKYIATLANDKLVIRENLAYIGEL